MSQIKNINKYPIINPSENDFFIGTKADDGSTANFDFNSVKNMIELGVITSVQFLLPNNPVEGRIYYLYDSNVPEINNGFYGFVNGTYVFINGSNENKPQQIIMYSGRMRIYNQYWTLAKTTPYGYTYNDINSLLGDRSAIDAINYSGNFGGAVQSISKLKRVNILYRNFELDNTPITIVIGVKRYSVSGALDYSAVLSTINFTAKNTVQYHNFDINSSYELQPNDVIIMQAHATDAAYDSDKYFINLELKIILE